MNTKAFVMTSFTLALMVAPAPPQAATRRLVQYQCNLNEASSPNIRGLRLGMSTEQVLGLFPGSNNRREIKSALESGKDPSANGVTTLVFEPSTYSVKDKFTGIDSVAAGLVGGKTVDISVSYVGASWSNIDEWVAKLAETYSLPAAQNWAPGPSENPNKLLKCDGVEIEAGIQGGGSTIRMRNTASQKAAEERAKAAEEAKRRAFKP